MDQLLEHLYKNLDQAKKVLNEQAIAVADMGSGKNYDDQLEKLIAYNLEKGRVIGIQDTINDLEKMLSATRSLKVV
ncbi:hypothetical protein P9436_11320 [Lysinibacillus capsici]|uniref:hypothetical protein n=1 Tax=Lysinibacillus capsici TaxID=2115968 RepID=UPI002E212587|nr:hypothetical protein [Lysinibacillus capsici]